MKIILSCAIVSLMLLNGCSGTKKAKAMSNTETSPQEGWTEELGSKNLKGTPYLTKGAQIVLEGVILSDRETLQKNNLEGIGSADLGNYSLEVSGVVKRYHCGPMEQCLSEGYIDHMPSIDKIKVTKQN